MGLSSPGMSSEGGSELVLMIHSKLKKRDNLLNVSVFTSHSNLVMRDVGNERIRHVLQVFLAVHILGKKDTRSCEFFNFPFCDKIVLSAFFNCECFL